MLTLKPRETAIIGALILMALAITILIATLLPPLSEADRAEMVIDATEGLPQDRIKPQAQ
jgi:hypothetical protein